MNAAMPEATWKLVPLGTNGYFPSFGRQTMSFLVLADRRALLLDAGTGVSRLIEPPVAQLVEPYEDLDVIVSHYHVDHVVGISYLPAVWPRGKVRILAPEPPLVDGDGPTAMRHLLGPPLFAKGFEAYGERFQLVRVREPELSWGSSLIRLWRQDHPGGSIGIRIGDRLAYVTDTSALPETIERVRGVRLLLHEIWWSDVEASGGLGAGHSAVSEVAEIAAKAAVGALMPVHHQPRRSWEDIEAMATVAAKRSGLPVWLPRETQVYTIE